MEVKQVDRDQLEQAAHRFAVSPGLVAAILADEQQRRDLWDRGQDVLAQVLLDLPWPLSAALQQLAERATGRSLDDQSFGPAQMKPATLRELAETDVLPLPDDLRLQLALLLRQEHAPLLIAARVRQTIDHWAAGGVDLSQRPDILATLYSIGLSSKRGVNPEPVASSRGKAVAEAARRFR